MERTRLVSGRAATDMLVAAGCCEPVQARHVLACGLAGLGFAYGSAVIYEHDKVAELAARPRIQAEDLWTTVPGHVVVIVRQHARALTGADVDPSRAWYGVDVLAPDAEQRLASSRWWEIGPRRRDLINQGLQENATVPLLVSVGGHIARGYDITSIDVSLSETFANGRWAFTLADRRPDWASRVENHWMRSSRGGALLVLTRDTPIQDL